MTGAWSGGWGIFGLGKKERAAREAREQEQLASQATAAAIQANLNAGFSVVPYMPSAVFASGASAGAAAGLSQQGGFWDIVAGRLSQLTQIQQQAQAVTAQVQGGQPALGPEATSVPAATSSSSLVPVLAIGGAVVAVLAAVAWALTRGGRRR